MFRPMLRRWYRIARILPSGSIPNTARTAWDGAGPRRQRAVGAGGLHRQVADHGERDLDVVHPAELDLLLLTVIAHSQAIWLQVLSIERPSSRQIRRSNSGASR